MLTSFITYLEDYLDRAGLQGLARGALGILAFASVLSALFGTSAFKAAGIVIWILGTLGLLAVQIGSNTGLRRDNADYRKLLSDQCNRTYEESDHLWRIDRWEEAVTIRANGDAKGTIAVRAMVETDDLPFFRLRVGPNWDQPEKDRRRVHVTVSSIKRNGIGGTRWPLTTHWLSDGRFEVLVHFGATVPEKGEELTLNVVYDWPGKGFPLMRQRKPDEFVMAMGRPLAYFSYEVTLPPSTKVDCDPVGLGESDRFTLDPATEAVPVVRLVVEDIAADRRIGVKLDLK
ncbi:hypothetical protein [Umezawaea tangerina]|uniref:Uncharacterized protein n=1 Tax=Umezawaea tangerina TaxID=84725 RepID=A0A2T0SC41_9PSEU|nr:hypothetical protein [Umezawaea tangerina]PRY30972.1 hypothetical protein CLV43_12374 [Umezawaea tangerina]